MARMAVLGISPTELAAAIGVSKATLTHWRNGTNQAGGKNLMRLAEALQCSPEWLATGNGPVEPIDPTPSESAYALISQLSARGASGPGFTNDHVEVRGGLAFKRDWLSRMGFKPGNLRVIYNSGTSNSPTLNDGDVLLVDTSRKTPIHGKMFAMHDAQNDVIIKRLIQNLGGEWLIRSDNQDKYRFPDMQVDAKNMGDVGIIGLVVWRGGEV